MRSLIALLVFAGTSFASGIHQEYRNINSYVWNIGGVCRHASTAVYNKAKSEGREVKLVRWMSNKRGTGHVIPVVKIDDKWCHFDAYKPFANDYFNGSHSACRDSVMTNETWLSVFSKRNVINGTVRVEDIPWSSWIEQTKKYERR